jgi:outer membrane receptor protein involved in Fe transport
LAEIMVEDIPQMYEMASNTNGQSYVNATGLTTVSLRNLGSDRTLVLIDGRRAVSNQYSSNTVSLNTIPTSMIQRIEIITGGSSATYGSDAIAGVVNIITQDDLVGLSLETRYGWTPEGGGEELSANMGYGTFFSDNRGYFFFGAEYNDQKGISWYERDRARWESSYDYNTTKLCNEMNTWYGDQCMRDITRDDWAEKSDGTAGGVFEEGRGNGGYWYTWEDGSNTLRDDWLEERDGVNPYIWDQIKIPEDRYALALKTSYDMTDRIKGTFQIMYAENNSFNLKSPEDEYDGGEVLILDRETLEPSTITPGKISPSNPFVPPEIVADNNGSIDWERRMYEVGNITTDNKRTTLRSYLAFQGEFAGDWQWDASIGYGESHQKQHRSNEINVVKERQALNAEYAEDGVTIQCADPEGRAAGCVPLNIFGVGSITPEMADWIRAEPTIDSAVEQIQVLAYVSGDVFDMPAGSVPMVFGVEYREDSVDLRTSEDSQYGGITFNLIPSFAASIDVWEAFTEAAFPLTESLDLEVSARVADYSPSGVDTVVSYTFGLMWEVAPGYRLRGNYARAQRAPSIAELYSPPRGDYDTFTDICDGTTATSTNPGHENCRLEPGIAAVIAAEGEFIDDNNGYGPAAGNPDVFEETADTWTLGFSMNPPWAENLRFAVDYWDISIEDKIDEIGNEEIMKQCYDSSQPWGPSNPFCNEISRHDDDGQIYQIMNRQYNLDSGKTRGLDVSMDYLWDFASKGDLTFQLDYTHMFEDSDTYEGLDGLVTVDYTGQLDFGNFNDRATFSFTWRYDEWRVRWRTKYKGEVVDHKDRVDDYKALFARNEDRCASGDSRCVTDPEVPKYLYYPDYWVHDLSVSYIHTTKWVDSVRWYAGIKNVFDDKGPFIPRTGDNYERGIGNFDSKYGGGIGRFVYAGVELNWD